jgi:hypothetical protein
MVADEEDDPVAARRAQIAALTPEQYDSLEAEVKAKLEALPNVNPPAHFFSKGSQLKQNGVRLNLNCTNDCCGTQQPVKYCSKTVPTRAHAAELLLASITADHADCIETRRRWWQKAGETPGETSGESSNAATSSSLFSHLGAVQRTSAELTAAKLREKEEHSSVVKAKEAVAAAQATVAKAQAAELAVVREREAAEQALEELKASFRPHKQARTEESPQESPQEMLPGEQLEEQQLEAIDPASWENYTLPYFRSLFRKYGKTSAKPVDSTNSDTSAPARGDDKGARGWRNHAQHGLYGTIRHWADGSPHRVAFMLAELATYFGVVDAVSLSHFLQCVCV